MCCPSVTQCTGTIHIDRWPKKFTHVSTSLWMMRRMPIAKLWRHFDDWNWDTVLQHIT
jgi:hypothetical protein